MLVLGINASKGDDPCEEMMTTANKKLHEGCVNVSRIGKCIWRGCLSDDHPGQSESLSRSGAMVDHLQSREQRGGCISPIVGGVCGVFGVASFSARRCSAA
jgi:hypothetical protein